MPLGDATNHWLKWFGLADDAAAQSARRTIDLSVNPPGTAMSVDLASVGVGVSQVLPVILLCLLSEPADVLILEQPDLHLHPALQKRMADFLLTFVCAGRQILVETHSDHLVNQLRTQVAADESDETRKLVKLIFAEQTDGITTYRESPINEYGGLSRTGRTDFSTSAPGRPKTSSATACER
ncbi:MAG: AAA family ATPase [bacterium]|nr:AAA family ATPase [bacterium]